MKAIIFAASLFCSSTAFGQLNPADFPATVKIQIGGATYTATQAKYKGGADVGWATELFGLFATVPPQLDFSDNVASVEINSFSDGAGYRARLPFTFPMILTVHNPHGKPSDPNIGGSWPATITVTK